VAKTPACSGTGVKKICTTGLSGISFRNTSSNKNIMIMNDTSGVVRMTPQLGASLMIIVLTTLEVSFISPRVISYAPREHKSEKKDDNTSPSYGLP